MSNRRPAVWSLAIASAVLLLSAGVALAYNFVEPNSSPEPVGDAPISAAAADFDGDADPDLAVVNQNSDNVTILRNTGGGNFVQPNSSPEAVGDSPRTVVAGDFDGDADSDLAVTNQNTDDVTILKNNGGGNFFEPSSSPEPAGDTPVGIAAADFDGDADPDLAVGNLTVGVVTVLRNNGGGNFVQVNSSPEQVGTSPVGIAAGDLDGDADPDLAVANLGDDNVTILRNTGSGNFVQPNSSPEPVGDAPYSLAVGDLNGDADNDIVVANFLSDNVTVLRNTGGGNFSQPNSSPEAAGDGPRTIVAVDLDGDADRDLAVTNQTSSNVTVLRNVYGGAFVEPNTSPETVGSNPVALAAGDFDGDADQDLAAGNLVPDNVTILRNVRGSPFRFR